MLPPSSSSSQAARKSDSQQHSPPSTAMSSPLSPPSSIPRKSSPLNPRSLHSDSSTSSISSPVIHSAERLSPFSGNSRPSQPHSPAETPYNQLRTRPRGQSTSNLEMSTAYLGGGVRRPSDNFGDDRSLFRGDAVGTHEGEMDTGIGQRLLRSNAFPTSSANIRGRSVSLTPQQEYAPLPDETSSGDGRIALDPPHEITPPVSSSVSVPVISSRTQSKGGSTPSILSVSSGRAAKPATSFVHAGVTETTVESFEVVRSVGGGKGNINVPWAEARVSRPWQANRGAQKKKEAIPEEQEEGWVATRDQVAKAAQSVLSTAGDITHELLEFTLEVGDFIPVPGLQTAVKTLLKIWDVLQMVDVSFPPCLPLRCSVLPMLLAMSNDVVLGKAPRRAVLSGGRRSVGQVAISSVHPTSHVDIPPTIVRRCHCKLDIYRPVGYRAILMLRRPLYGLSHMHDLAFSCAAITIDRSNYGALDIDVTSVSPAHILGLDYDARCLYACWDVLILGCSCGTVLICTRSARPAATIPTLFVALFPMTFK
ncbi:hypothetical protein PTI98_012255 [Pleurotus ostreatus]|nr:hypothetical protein PTI98_012255 [Pleurotus ostreatus]